jgi:hypothetical protein
MTNPLPDITESAPTGPSCPDGQAGADAAGCRRRVGRWLGKLADIGMTLRERISRLAAARQTYDTAPDARTVDLDLGRGLLRRALRWTRALQARLTAEAKAARAGMTPAQRLAAVLAGLQGASDRNRNPSVYRRPPAERPQPDDCIDGKPAAAVIGQICADLDGAATLLHGRSLMRKIAGIAAAARALLGSPGEAWTPLPIACTRDRAADEPQPAMIGSIAGLFPSLVPDTG